MAVHVHFFRIGVPHALPGVVRTDRFPVSGMIVTDDHTPDVGGYVYAKAQQVAHDLLSLIQSAKTQRYVRPVSALTLEEEDRKRTGRDALLALPEPALAHINQGLSCPACDAAFMAEYQGDESAIDAHMHYLYEIEQAYAGIAGDPNGIETLELRLNRQFHDLPDPSSY